MTCGQNNKWCLKKVLVRTLVHCVVRCDVEDVILGWDLGMDISRVFTLLIDDVKEGELCLGPSHLIIQSVPTSCYVEMVLCYVACWAHTSTPRFEVLPAYQAKLARQLSMATYCQL